MVDGLPPVGGNKNLCRSCLQGKQHREPFLKQASCRGTAPLQLVHMDLCGPLPEASLGGSLYFLLLVDDFSRFSWVFFLQQKSDAFRSFSQWFHLAQNESGHTLKNLRSDKGGEFTSHDMSHFCSQHGV